MEEYIYGLHVRICDRNNPFVFLGDHLKLRYMNSLCKALVKAGIKALVLCCTDSEFQGLFGGKNDEEKVRGCIRKCNASFGRFASTFYTRPNFSASEYKWIEGVEQMKNKATDIFTLPGENFFSYSWSSLNFMMGQNSFSEMIDAESLLALYGNEYEAIEEQCMNKIRKERVYFTNKQREKIEKYLEKYDLNPEEAPEERLLKIGKTENLKDLCRFLYFECGFTLTGVGTLLKYSYSKIYRILKDDLRRAKAGDGENANKKRPDTRVAEDPNFTKN